jgi:hypothetical protein
VSAVGQPVTFFPSDDSFVRTNFPDENNGSLDNLRSFKKLAETDTYLKFAVAGLTGPVTSAKLRLFVVDGSPSAGTLYSVSDTTWSEGAITWNTKPPPTTLIGPAGAAPLGQWIEIDLGGTITGDGIYSFALLGASSDGAWFSSKEGANDPQLVVFQN